MVRKRFISLSNSEAMLSEGVDYYRVIVYIIEGKSS